ncbi:MAG: nickel-dependent lactate racemase [Acidobacteriota bacterium]|nr:nickel-dependent lactate racemase [Acidobacteriota bacterium]
MQINFSQPEFAPADIPDSNLLAVLAPREADHPRPLADLLEEALDQPAGAGRIEEVVPASARVLLLVDDITRQTPAAGLLPGIIRRIERAGVTRQNVQILIAAGTHSHMSREELEQKIGSETLAHFAVFLHHWKDAAHMRLIGALPDGTPVRVNKMLGEADVVIGVGQIVPHRVMGYTGGSSIVQPGVSGPEVTGHTHWLSAVYPGAEIMGFADNPVRREVEQIAKLAGLTYIVNVVMDRRERVIRVVAGDPIAAHHKGAAFSREIFGVPQSDYADIVIAESYPADYDLWQAAKGIYASELSVRQGGVVILITPCTHGVSIEHPEVEHFGYPGVEEVKQMVAGKKIDDLVAAAHLAHVGRVIRDRARGIMVCPGIPSDVQKKIGFEPAPTPQRALEIALALTGPNASIAALLQGGHVLPLVEKSDPARAGA